MWNLQRWNAKQANYRWPVYGRLYILINFELSERRKIRESGIWQMCWCEIRALPFLREQSNSLAWKDGLCQLNQPFQIIGRYLFQSTSKEHSITLHSEQGPSDYIAVIGSHSRRHLTANPLEGQETCLTYSPPPYHYWDQLCAVGLSSRGRLHIDRLVMKVKMSSGYQSGGITTFKACKSTYTTRRSLNPLKVPADFILQTPEMDVTPPHLHSVGPGSTDQDSDWWITSLSSLRRLPAASGCDNPSVGRRDGTGTRVLHFLKRVTD